jgi:PBP1b-binding outer membrane lipoprotein LpoB
MDPLKSLKKVTKMALGTQVEESLKEAESSLRNALAFAARTERPMVCSVISDMIHRIESVMDTDKLLDKLENRTSGDSGTFGVFFNND